MQSRPCTGSFRERPPVLLLIPHATLTAPLPPPPSSRCSQPRLKKRAVPKITFLEDRLLGKFRAAHPAADALQTPALFTEQRAVSSLFIEQQMAALRAGLSEGEAFTAAQDWMLSHSARVFPRLHAPAHVMAAAAHTPRTLDAMRKRLEKSTLEQLQVAQWALGDTFAAPPRPPPKDLTRVKAGQADVVGLRARSRELQLPRAPLSEGERQLMAARRAEVEAREAKDAAAALEGMPSTKRLIPLPGE